MTTKTENCIHCICNAYHQGFEVGYSQRVPKQNPYSDTTNEYKAWNYGYNIGYGAKSSVLNTRKSLRYE